MTRARLEACFRAGLDRVSGERCVAAALGGGGTGLEIAGEAIPPSAGLRVLAAGKAASPMAAALVAAAGERIRGGLVVTKDGCGIPGSLRLLEAGHPVPDARSEAAGREALALVSACGPDEELVALLSGGASALLSCPQPGLDRADLAETTSLLLACGAPIDELNAVRKHLTCASGGRLARACRARRSHVLALSDVPDDDPAVIASGPFHGDPSTFADALEVLGRRGIRGRVPEPVIAHLEAGARGEGDETAAPGAAPFDAVRTRILARNRDAVEAVMAAAEARGMRAALGPEALAGEAREVGTRLAQWARAQPASGAERLFVAGGETTVTLRGDGRGGRNQELALAAALALEGSTGIGLLAAGTDGSDGPTPAAGAHADGGSLARGRAAGVDAAACLARNDSHGFFVAEGGAFFTGPTGTNVMDLVLIQLSPGRSG